MALTVYDNVKEEMLDFTFFTIVQLKDSSGAVVGTYESGGETYAYAIVEWGTPDGDQRTQSEDVVFDMDAGDNVASLSFRSGIPGDGEDLFTYQFESVYNYATAGTFTISGMKIIIN